MFPLDLGAKKDRGTDIFGFGLAKNLNESQKMKEGGGGGGGEGRRRFPSFLSPPPRAFTRTISRAVFDSRSSFFAPKPHGNARLAGY